MFCWNSRNVRQLTFGEFSLQQIYQLEDRVPCSLRSNARMRKKVSSAFVRSAHTMGLLPATSPLKSLHEGTGRRD